jgi:regulator of sigma E protease
MFILNFAWYYVILFLVLLTVLIFVHELGHYWVARRNKIRIDVFSIGFGKEIYGWTDSVGTRWKIGMLPLGGYVKMFGHGDEIDDDGEERVLTPAEQAVSFSHKRLWQRFAVIVGGPLANFLFAILLFAVLYATVGRPLSLAGVGSVAENGAAAEIGIQQGDRVLSVNGEPITWFTDLYEKVSALPGQKVAIVIRRDGNEIPMSATLKRHERKDGTVIGRLGVTPDPNQIGYFPVDPLASVRMAVDHSVTLSFRILEFLGDLIVGKGDTDDVGGPLGIAKIVGEIAQNSMIQLLFVMAAISVNLALINMLPIPVLDGGHLVLLLAEALRGRPVGPRAQEYCFRFGLILVLLVFAAATVNDVAKSDTFKFLMELVT